MRAVGLDSRNRGGWAAARLPPAAAALLLSGVMSAAAPGPVADGGGGTAHDTSARVHIRLNYSLREVGEILA